MIVSIFGSYIIIKLQLIILIFGLTNTMCSTPRHFFKFYCLYFVVICQFRISDIKYNQFDNNIELKRVSLLYPFNQFSSHISSKILSSILKFFTCRDAAPVAFVYPFFLVTVNPVNKQIHHIQCQRLDNPFPKSAKPGR